MYALVRYFGDTAAPRRRCGICDFCNTEGTVAQDFRPANDVEQAAIARVLDLLKYNDGLAAGRLYTQAFADGELGRRPFEELLGAMARSALVDIIDASFEKDGKRIDFRKVRLTRDGREPGAAASVLIPQTMEVEPRPKKRAGKAKTKTKAKKPVARPGNSEAILTVLKAWRLAEAKRLRVPAFRVLTDKALQAIADTQPRNDAELAELPGIGAKLVKKYGEQIFRVLASVH